MGRLLVANGSGTPFFKPSPEALDLVVVYDNSARASRECLVLLRWDRGLGTEIGEVTGIAPVGDPSQHPWQPVEERHRVRQLVGLP